MKIYSKYKDSGIEWIGKVPNNWEVIPIRWSCTVFSGGTPSKDKPEYWNSDDIPWLASGEINKKRIVNAEEYMSFLGFENSSAKWIEPKSVLIALAGQGKTKGTVALLEFKATCNQSMAAIVPNKSKMYYSYLFYYLDSQYTRIRGLVGDDSRDGLNLEIVKSIKVPLPSLKEQIAISHYLDKKTNEIDRLIEKKVKLIELLLEEKASFINQAVTRGVDSKVKTKYSGIDWLGVIPKRWSVKKLKYIISRIEVPIEDTDFLVAVENIESGTGRLIGMEEKKHYQGSISAFKKGDVLFNKLRPYLAKVHSTERNGGCIGELLILRASQIINSKFLFYRLLSDDFISIVNSSTEGAKMPRASWDDFIQNLEIPFPNVKEQSIIADLLDSEIDRISTITCKIETEIELLREYRMALINEVVTGKINVSVN